MYVLQSSAVENDGYSHKGALQSPHTQHEAYIGLTLDHTAKVTYELQRYMYALHAMTRCFYLRWCLRPSL